jgi:indoleamine 2,3-dioxygenase
MRTYMPREHREFLDVAEKLPSIRDFVESRPDDKTLVDAYNSCLQQLSNWRSRHTGVVTTHIVNQARKQKPAEVRPDPEEVRDGLSVKDEYALQGSGGSALIPFLKQARQETLNARR